VLGVAPKQSGKCESYTHDGAQKSDSNWNYDSTGPAIIDVRKNLTSPIECGIKCTSLHNDTFV